MPTRDELIAKKTKALHAARDLYAPYGEHDRVPEDVIAKVKPLIDEARQADAEIKALDTKADEAAKDRADFRNLASDLGTVNRTTEEKTTTSGLIVPKDGDRLGDLFVKSEQYQTFLKTYPNSANARNGMRVSVAPVTVDSKTLVTGASSTQAGAFIETQRLPGLQRLGRKPLAMRDLVTKVSVSTDTIEYVRETANTNNADFVPEATSSAAPTQDGSTGPLINNAGGGYKPEGGFAFEVVQSTVATLAEWMPITRQALADAALMQGLINAKLTEDLDEVEDNEILNGTGGATSLPGILTTAGVDTYNTAATVLLTADFGKGLAWAEGIKRAKTKLRVEAGRRVNATAVVMNPADADEIWLARQAKNPAVDASDGSGNLIVAGLPVIESQNIAAGTALIGDFTKAYLYDREQTTVYATDSHADFFIRNLIAVLAEKRLGFGVQRPGAFLKLDLAAID